MGTEYKDCKCVKKYKIKLYNKDFIFYENEIYQFRYIVCDNNMVYVYSNDDDKISDAGLIFHINTKNQYNTKFYEFFEINNEMNGKI